MNYDSYLAHSIEIFNDRMDAGFSGDHVILTCFMTEDQKEIFEQFCAQYFPYRLKRSVSGERLLRLPGILLYRDGQRR